MNDMKLYRICTETHDGEHEYYAHDYIMAADLEQAKSYAQGFMNTFFGELDDDGDPMTEDDGDGYVAAVYDFVRAKLVSVEECTGMPVHGIDGSQWWVTFHPEVFPIL